jgi:hypothetical protein
MEYGHLLNEKFDVRVLIDKFILSTYIMFAIETLTHRHLITIDFEHINKNNTYPSTYIKQCFSQGR